MIVALNEGEFPRVLPLYREVGGTFPLISAVIQKLQRGQVFVDERQSPRSALVVTDFGFTMFVGAEDNELLDAGLTDLFSRKNQLRPSYLLWYSPPIGWQKKLHALGPDLVRERERVRFEFRPDQADWLNTPVNAPTGLELRELTPGLIPKTEKFGVKLDSRFWSSAKVFSENGIGVCLMKDGEMVSLCYAATIADRLAEVDVVTDPEYRGRGLASVTARQFIKECLGRGVVPTWDCFAHNSGSMKLAAKLSFVAKRTYAFYSFNVPARL